MKVLVVFSNNFYKEIRPFIYEQVEGIKHRGINNMKKNIFLVPSRIMYFIFRDISFWFGLLIFWPKNNIKNKYIEVKF